MVRKPLQIIFAVALTILILSAVCAAKTPTVTVRDMLENLMAIQTNPKLQGSRFREQRKKAIKKVIAANFDFDTMAKESLGSYWNRLDDAQRKEFKSIFATLFQDSYTRLVLDFLHKEKVEYLTEEVKRGKAKVTTTIIRINDKIPVNYFLALKQKRWINQDVEVDGVSIVKNYKKAFARVIKKGSYDKLLQRMRIQLKAIQ